jgi:general secretion pathway protein A
LLGQLDSRTRSAFIFNPRLNPLDFFRILFEELEIEAQGRTKAEYLLALNQFLIDRLEKNERTLLIVDEAQNLSAEMLEEIRLLSNLETPRSKLIQIMLVGQPELKDMLRRPELRQLRQRIALAHHLRPFDEEETSDYVEERLRKSGYTGRRLFKRAALKELYRVTGGTPRLINSVCDSAMLLGFAKQRTVIDAGMIREVASDLELGEPADGPDAGGSASGVRGRRRGLLRLFRA